MRYKLILLFFLIIIFSCNKNNDKLVNSKSIQTAKISRIINLDKMDTIYFSSKLLIDFRPIPDNTAKYIPKNSDEYIKNINFALLSLDSLLFILDRDKSRILKFDTTGKFISFISNPGSGPSEILQPYWIALKKSDLFIADLNNGRMQILDINGKYIKQINNFRIDDSYSRFAIGKNNEIITRSSYGENNFLSIYDSLGNKIKVIGDLLYEYGSSKTQQMVFNEVFILVDTSRNHIWCLFEKLPFIRKYNFEGTLLEEVKIEGLKINDMMRSTQIKLDRIKNFPNRAEYFILCKSAILVENKIIFNYGGYGTYEIEFNDAGITKISNYQFIGLPNSLMSNYIILNWYCFSMCNDIIYAWNPSNVIIKAKKSKIINVSK